MLGIKEIVPQLLTAILGSNLRENDEREDYLRVHLPRR